MSVSTVRGRIARQLGFRMFAIASTQPIVAAASDVNLATNAKKVKGCLTMDLQCRNRILKHDVAPHHHDRTNL